MRTNFVFENSVGVQFEGKHFDLHGFFLVSGFVVNPRQGSATMEFETIKKFKNKVHDVRAVRLEFDEITHLEFSPKICTNISDSLEEFGFKSPGDKDDNWLKTFEQSDPNDHLFVRLSSLEFFRVQCALARFVPEKI